MGSLGYFDVFFRLGAAVLAGGLAFWPLVLLSCCFGLLILVLEPIDRWLKARVS